MKEVHYRGAFAKKFGIRCNIKKVPGHTVALDHAPNPFVRIYGHRALFNDDLIVVDRTGNFARDGVYIGQVGAAGLALRSSHSNEYHLRLLRSATQIGG